MTKSRNRLSPIGALLMVLLLAAPASAHDATNLAGPSAVTTDSDSISPSGSRDQTNNGFRVYLSAPRHPDSGSRGECNSSNGVNGSQENINGRRFNWYAANGNYVNGSYSPNSYGRNLHSRGYVVRVSRNDPEPDPYGYLQNRDESRQWGAQIHIVTHSNAVAGGCPNSTNYLLGIWETNHPNDELLTKKIVANLDSQAPGGSTTWSSSGLAELSTHKGTGSSTGDAYIELQFHTNPTGQEWMKEQSDNGPAARYGLSVDSFLQYP